MCGRYVITLPVQAMADLFDLAGPGDAPGGGAWPNLSARYNVAPTQGVPIVRIGETGRRELGIVRWGLVPSWAREVTEPPQINARGETVAEKASFRNAFRRRRCLVPVDGFYEWRRAEGRKPRPVFIHAPDRGALVLAGIWEHWMNAEGSKVQSMAIVTTDANATLAPVHHRMPVILAPDAWDIWLTGTPQEARALIGPAPETAVTFHPVSTRVNKVAHDDVSLIEEIPEEETGAPDLPRDGQLSLL